jgi:hypothetical protein
VKLLLSSAAPFFCLAALLSIARGEDLTVIRTAGSAQQLIVRGKPILILGAKSATLRQGLRHKQTSFC